MKLKKMIFLSLLMFIAISGPLSASGLTSWGVERNDTLHYWYHGERAHILLVDGYMTVSCEYFQASSIYISTASDFTGNFSDIYAQKLALTNQQFLPSESVHLDIGLNTYHSNESTVVIYEQTSFNGAKAVWTAIAAEMEELAIQIDTVNFTSIISDNSFEYELRFNTSNIYYKKMEYTNSGILKYMHIYRTLDGVRDSRQFIKKVYPGPYPDWYSYGIITGGLILIAVVGCCVVRRRNSYSLKKNTE